MGFFDKLTDFVYDDVYSRDRESVPWEIREVTEQALVLAKKKRLTPEAIGQLAHWDVDILQYIGQKRGAILPGGPKEVAAINKAARQALEMAVERRAGVKPKPPKRKGAPTSKPGREAPRMAREPYNSQANNEALWQDHTKRLAKALRQMDDRDVVIVSPISNSDRYVQFVRQGSVLWGECSGASVDGGPAALSPQEQNALLEMGWGAPDLGPSDFPNFRARWAPVEPPEKSAAFMSKEDAKEAARFAIETLRGPLGVHHASDIQVETGAM